MRKVYYNFFYWIFKRVTRQNYNNDFDGAFGAFCCLCFIIEAHYVLIIALIRWFGYGLPSPNSSIVFLVINILFNYFMIFYKKNYLIIKDFFKNETQDEHKKHARWCTLYCISVLVVLLLLGYFIPTN